MLLEAIKNTQSTKTAADYLNISRRTTLRLKNKYGIPVGADHLIRNSLDIVKNKDVKENKEEKPKFVEPINDKLVNKFKGKFKEKSDSRYLETKKFVITSVQNDKMIDLPFFNTLKAYCIKQNAQLLLVPNYYKMTEFSSFLIPENEQMYFDNVSLTENLKLLSRLRVLPTIVDPFAGLDGVSKGDSIIIAHPQVALKTMATLGESPAQMYTTGSLTVADDAYQDTKTGYKAEFNHSIAALLIETGIGDSFFARHLNADENGGFYDCCTGGEGYYIGNEFYKLSHIEALYTGDEHAIVADPLVINATYTNDDSIANILKPKVLCRGDVLDFQSQNHHDLNDSLMQYGKFQLGLSSISDELNHMCKHINNTTPEFSRNLLIDSNHNDAFYKWLTTINIKGDFVNAKLYHKMTYLMMEELEQSPSGVKYPNLIELWIKNSEWVYNETLTDKLEFVGRRGSYKICDVEVSMHGDKGINGAKGSPIGFSRLPTKSIVGHSHSPSIKQGCYTVGTSSLMDLSYNAGPSSWMQSHCIIYPEITPLGNKNGKRQMLSIINGKWRA